MQVMKQLCLLVCALGILQCYSQRPVRQTQLLNKGWLFTRDTDIVRPADTLWQKVDLPHTWNIADVMDDEPGYYRGIGWYRNTVQVNDLAKDYYLHFEGVNQVAEVWVNGRFAGKHVGGYTGFYIHLQPYLKKGINRILVKADNSYNKDIAPLSADFTFYGGIYRSVHLVTLNRTHFSCNDKGSTGSYITISGVQTGTATVAVRGMISNIEDKAGQSTIVLSMKDKKGKVIAAARTPVPVIQNRDVPFTLPSLQVTNPHLWTPGDPYLYNVEISLYRNGKLADQLQEKTGFRWFKFDAATGFYLNGQRLKLYGASRHQDLEGRGNAVPDSLSVRDMVLLKQMGANFLRVAHYPQAKAVLDACDSLGILASVEIPIVNEITESQAFTANCLYMQQEMIRQNFNHPCVIIWAYMNEILLKPRYPENTPQRAAYVNHIRNLAQQLDSLTRQEDPQRYTMLAAHGNFSAYHAAGLTAIPMVMGWNLYSGWYSSNQEGFAAFLDKHRKELPDKPLIVTEYGADADPRIHSTSPQRFDKSMEYALQFHEYYFRQMQQRDFVAGGVVWNLADFNAEARAETMPHINNKGLLTWNRKPKALYYLYQAMLSGKPFVKLLCADEAYTSTGADTAARPFYIASNQPAIHLQVNNSNTKQLTVSGYMAVCALPVTGGQNTITLQGTNPAATDTAIVVVKSAALPAAGAAGNCPDLNILLGARRSYYSPTHNQNWISSPLYQPGRFGYIGGQPYKTENGRQPYGTDKNILQTEDDPVYQTQQLGIQAYKLDVPAGDYDLTLHFAVLAGAPPVQSVYNLGAGAAAEASSPSVFHVLLNGKKILSGFEPAKEGVLVPVVKHFSVHTDQQGITLLFEPVVGEPFLNALQIHQLRNNQP
jgi:beta-galactosidase